ISQSFIKFSEDAIELGHVLLDVGQKRRGLAGVFFSDGRLELIKTGFDLASSLVPELRRFEQLGPGWRRFRGGSGRRGLGGSGDWRRLGGDSRLYGSGRRLVIIRFVRLGAFLADQNAES